MKRIHFLATKESIIDYTLSPVRSNKSNLLERGYAVKIFYKLHPSLLDCNILCLISKSTHKILGDTGPIYKADKPIIQMLKKARIGVDKIIWMDDSDSTTVTHFELLPYIDLYLKKQLLKDKSLYKNKYYGGRIFSNYYHQEFGITDKEPFNQFFPLEEDDWDKVDLSWNIGLGDMHNAFTWSKYVKKYACIKQGLSFTEPMNDRPIDIFLRTSSNLTRESIAFQRKEMLKRLKSLIVNESNMSGMVGNHVSRTSENTIEYLPEVGGKLSASRYRKIMKHTKIAPSPFGWGEIGVRDYEAFMYGCVLLKPDVSHMVSWPNIFIPNETYVPINWDFENMKSIIENLLENKEKRQLIASNGQSAYQESISKAGMEEFCNRFVQKMEV
jgi:glycosyl transferase family 1